MRRRILVTRSGNDGDPCGNAHLALISGSPLFLSWDYGAAGGAAEAEPDVVGAGLGLPSSMMIERWSSHLVPFQTKPGGQLSGVWLALFEAPQALKSAARREQIVRVTV